MSADAILMTADGYSPLRYRPGLSPPMPGLRLRAVPLTIVVAAHLGLALLALATSASAPARSVAEDYVPVFIRPRVIVADFAPTQAPVVRVPKRSPLVPMAHVADSDRPLLAVKGIGTVPPRPVVSETNLAPFVEQAGLERGRGATVVLRVEVLATGEVGRIAVDVSGGSDRVDQAAIAYARTIPWERGLIDGHAASLWIRWGVRLQA